MWGGAGISECNTNNEQRTHIKRGGIIRIARLGSAQVFAFLVKLAHVWQLQSEKQQISHPKHRQEMQPLHVGEQVQPLYTLRLALSSSSSQVILNTERKQLFTLFTIQLI